MLCGHVFRNAMLLIVAGFPQAFINILFTSQLPVEIVFSLDGLGLLGFQAAIQRDYPVMFGTLYIFTLLGLLLQIVGDTLSRWSIRGSTSRRDADGDRRREPGRFDRHGRLSAGAGPGAET